MTEHDGPVRVSRFEWERLMMMSVPHPQNLKLLPIGIFMSADGGSARPGNNGLAMFGPHEKTWAKLLRWAVGEGWLLLVQRGGARRGPNGTTVVRASVYAASVPQLVWKRREEILGAPPFKADGSLNGAPKGSPEALKGAPEGSLVDDPSLNGAPMAPFNGADPSLKGAPRDSLPNPLKGASDGFEGSVSRFEGSAQTLPHHVVTPSTSLSVAEQVVSAADVVAEHERETFIDWINNQHQPRGPAWWRTVAKNGDLTELAEKWRAEQTTAAPSLPPCCERCRAENPAAEHNVRWRRRDGQPCPDCHPNILRSEAS
ncbi:hypothetical protein QBB33_15465 [Streptomyces scabiei]|uniref:hypothetical protein n=1 Tax=Streptomyces scabiei TaxID=1930 RepID=UPI002FF34842